VVTVTTDHQPLVDRIRANLAAEPSTREVLMFGGLSFMVNDKLVVAAQRDGDLLVRADPERNRELVALPGAGPAEMGAGRAMGPGWISVSARTLAADEQLSFWTGVALEYNARAGRTKR
jgi:TfoX/Sxy family transcriptional regulator of competence genes